MPLSENPQDQPAKHRRVDIQQANARAAAERRKFLEDLKRGVAKAPKAPQDEDFGLGPLVDEEGRDVSDVPPDLKYPPPKKKDKPKEEIDVIDDEPIDPAKRKEILQEFNGIINKVYFSDFPPEWETYEPYFRGLIIEQATRYYYLALAHNWGKKATAKALEEDLRKWKSRMKDEGAGEALVNLSKDVWNGVFTKTPKVLKEPNAYIKGRKVDIKRLNQTQTALNDVTRWFVERYIDKKLVRNWARAWIGKKEEKRDITELHGAEDRHFIWDLNWYNPIEAPLKIFFGDRIQVPKFWADKMPYEILTEEIMNYYAELTALQAAVSPLEGPHSEYFGGWQGEKKRKVAEKFAKILIEQFRKTLKSEHQNDYDKRIENDREAIIAEIVKRLP